MKYVDQVQKLDIQTLMTEALKDAGTTQYSLTMRMDDWPQIRGQPDSNLLSVDIELDQATSTTLAISGRMFLNFTTPRRPGPRAMAADRGRARNQGQPALAGRVARRRTGSDALLPTLRQPVQFAQGGRPEVSPETVQPSAQPIAAPLEGAWSRLRLWVHSQTAMDDGSEIRTSPLWNQQGANPTAEQGTQGATA